MQFRISSVLCCGLFFVSISRDYLPVDVFAGGLRLQIALRNFRGLQLSTPVLFFAYGSWGLYVVLAAVLLWIFRTSDILHCVLYRNVAFVAGVFPKVHEQDPWRFSISVACLVYISILHQPLILHTIFHVSISLRGRLRARFALFRLSHLAHGVFLFSGNLVISPHISALDYVCLQSN